METILNLVWLAVTLAVLGLWRFRWSVSRGNRRHSPKLEAVAILCFIALVFPVISLTDDLHPEIVAVDAVGGKRNSCLLAAGSCNARAPIKDSRTHAAFGVLPRPILLTDSTASEAVSPTIVSILAFVVGSPAGRSPPKFL
jgi:hypothetical protein